MVTREDRTYVHYYPNGSICDSTSVTMDAPTGDMHLTEMKSESTNSSYTITYKKEEYEYEEYLYKSELLEEIKWGWRNNHKEFKPKQKMRPNIQLRNVCADGRGWAC